MRRFLRAMMWAAVLASHGIPAVAEPDPWPVDQSFGTVPMWALPDFRALVKQYGAAVVTIDVLKKPKFQSVTVKKPNGKNDYAPLAQGTGSGFIIADDGYVITNAHVVENGTDILIRLHDRREFPARVIGTDGKTDIALLKIDADHLPVVKRGSMDELQVGEWVMAIGAPFGLENTVTTGIVSSKNRYISDAMTPFIQSSAIINPGNSGGPLFNLRGEVVGVSSRGTVTTQGNFGLSLAIPIDLAMQVVERLRKDGKAPHSRIGVVLQDVTSRLARAMELPHADGQLISGVQKDSPAYAAGLKAGDYVVSFNGVPVRGNLPFLVGMTPQGQASTIEVIRRGQTHKLSVVPQDLDSDRTVTPATKHRREEGIRGMVLEEVTPEDQQKIGSAFALRIKKSVHDDAKAGGFLIAVGLTPIMSFDDAVQKLDNSSPCLITLLTLGEDPKLLFHYAVVH